MNNLRQRKWYTSEEIQYLRDHYAENGEKRCAEYLGRTPDSVGRFARRTLGLRCEGARRTVRKRNQQNEKDLIWNLAVSGKWV